MRSMVVCVFLTGQDAHRFNLKHFAEACYRFTPVLAIHSSEALFLEITGCEGLYSYEGLTRRVLGLFRRFSIGLRVEIRVTFAEDESTALALARYPRCQKKEDLPLEALLEFRSLFLRHEELGVNQEVEADLKKKFRKGIELLKKLGLRTLGDFIQLPREGFASRFGKEILESHLRVCGELKSPWTFFQLPLQILEKTDVDELTDLEPALFVLKNLMDCAMARLRGMAKRASVIQVTLHLKPWENRVRSRVWKIELPIPQGSALALIPILQEKLSFDLQKSPLEAPMERIEFEVLESVPGRSAQRDFLNQREENFELWDKCVGRLVQQLGKENVFVALPVERYLPEGAWVKTWDGEGSCPDVLPVRCGRRPARVLKDPERLNYWKKDSPSALFYLISAQRVKRWKVVQWKGPERIMGEWWREGWEDESAQGFDRDYYEVITETGEVLWVFLNRQADLSTGAPSFYLHGFFD